MGLLMVGVELYLALAVVSLEKLRYFKVQFAYFVTSSQSCFWGIVSSRHIEKLF